MTREECIDMVKFYKDTLYKIILGIGAANVTLIGFAFERKVSFYIFIAFWLMLVSVLVFRYTKKNIAFLYLSICALDQHDDIAFRYASMFLRCNSPKRINSLKKLVAQFNRNQMEDREFKSRIARLANPTIFPRNFGIYATLFWTTSIIFFTYLASLILWHWSPY